MRSRTAAPDLAYRAADPDGAYFSRSLAFSPESIVDQDRSVEAVLATEDPVISVRMGADGQVTELLWEVLRMDGCEIPEQIPLLDTHMRGSIRNQLGSWRSMRIANSELVGRMYVSSAEENTWTKVRERHIRDVSVGREALEKVQIPPGQTRNVKGTQYTAPQGRALWIVTRWRPIEGSLTSIGSDRRTKVRTDPPPLPPTGPAMRFNPRQIAHLVTLGLAAGAADEAVRTFYQGLDAAQRAAVDALADRPAPFVPRQIAFLAALGLAQGAADEAARAFYERLDTPQRNACDALAGQTGPPPLPADRAGRTSPDEAAIRQQAIDGERRRVARIRELAGTDVPPDIATRAIAEGWDETRASAEFLTAIRTARTPSSGRAAPAAHVHGHDQDVTCRSLAAGLAIAGGLDPTRVAYGRDLGHGARDRLTAQDADLGHAVRSMSGFDLVRECARIDTGRWYRDRDEAFRAAVSGGTFSYVFGTNVYARLMAGWNEVVDTTVFVAEEDVENFLEHEDISITVDGRLKLLARGGTASDATMSDSGEPYRVKRFARKITWDEQDVIDDRLGARLAVAVEMGRDARRLKPDLVYSTMLANPNLRTTARALFNVTDGNLGTGVLSIGNLGTYVSAIAKQRLNNKQLDLSPQYLIVPEALRWTGREVLTKGALAKVGTAGTVTSYMPINTVAADTNMTLVIDDRIGALGVVDPITEALRAGTDTNYFLSTGGQRTIRVVFRSGTGRQPRTRTYELSQGQWGLGNDINYDIGCGPMDWRGVYKSSGTVA